MPPIAADADGANVLYLGSLSKLLAPGLRVGFIVSPAPLMKRLVALRLASDMQGDAAVEYAIAKLFEDGEVLRHLRRMRSLYARRRDALAAALLRSARYRAQLSHPERGDGVPGRRNARLRRA
ncbi:MAG: aminotransferase class I/II-fold pyridoxal phosphate-dependent enzyme [Myxococcaceae bacterium]